MESCKGCIHENHESEDCLHCSRAYTDEYEKKPVQTNWERIRFMSIEEMADLLEAQSRCECCAMRYEDCRKISDLSCYEQILKWLMQPVS